MGVGVGRRQEGQLALLLYLEGGGEEKEIVGGSPLGLELEWNGRADPDSKGAPEPKPVTLPPQPLDTGRKSRHHAQLCPGATCAQAFNPASVSHLQTGDWGLTNPVLRTAPNTKQVFRGQWLLLSNITHSTVHNWGAPVSSCPKRSSVSYHTKCFTCHLPRRSEARLSNFPPHPDNNPLSQ